VVKIDFSHEKELYQPRLAPLIRVSGQVGLALLALFSPIAGDNRFLLAGVLLFLSLPTAIVLNVHFKAGRNGWVEPLFDLLLVVTLIHFVPNVWHIALCIALMIALAPSVSLHPKSYLIYSLFAAILICGLSFAAWIHNVEGWFLPIAAVTVVYPSVIYYAHWQVRRADELRERSHLLRGITQLAGSVAHDFNNVLTGVSGYAELALHDLPPDHPAAKSLTEVVNGASRASLLCGQLLTFAGRNVKSHQSVNLSEELVMIANLLQPVISKGVEISIKHNDGNLFVQGDRSQLQQVIMNVILNAGEATTTTPSTIELSLSQEERSDGAWAVLQISDQGCGISQQSLDKIFDPFYTTKERGHGLGLASALRIMEVHGGKIAVNSTVGRGTQVKLSLPLSEHVTPSVSPTATSTTRHKGKVLVVDDEEAVRAVASGLLKHLDYDVVEANNAYDAIDIYRAHQATCIAILLDLSMPGKDGWACLADLRRINKDVPVIICSGYNPEQTQAENPTDPHLAFLSKPFRKADLDEVLNTLLPASPA
jgi:signal transduction histidine kinase/ActR/RegA family two-component response regulator